MGAMRHGYEQRFRQPTGEAATLEMDLDGFTVTMRYGGVHKTARMTDAAGARHAWTMARDKWLDDGYLPDGLPEGLGRYAVEAA